jgi:hypothetical protein
MPRKEKSTKPEKLPKVQGVAMGKVIAIRQLESATRPEARIVVEIGAPRRPRGRDDFFCPYRIRGAGDETTRAAYGVDAVQALQLVMHAIGSELARHGDLRFFEDEDLGFPQPEDLLILAEAKRRRGPSSGG